MDEKSKVVILYSGGADSILLIEFAKKMKKGIYALLIDYGQLHKEELEFAEKYCKNNKIEYQKVTILDYNVKSGLTTGEKNLYEGVHSHNVPARNTIFLSIAAGIAESNKIDTIWIGPDMSDFYGEFPDCKQVYIGKINEVFKIAFSYPIIVEAPLLGMSKEMVLSLLDYFGIKMNEIFSGYGQFE